MIRVLAAVAKLAPIVVSHNTSTVIRNVTKPHIITPSARNLSTFCLRSPTVKPLLADKTVTRIANTIITRNVIKFSYRKGKRKSVRAVLRRFYRLHWGAWIRTKCGRHKKLWKKSSARKRRLRQHVFCNATQSYLLDKMVGPYWRKPKYYVDDPYEPYHSREEWKFTYNKPRPYFPPEN